VSWNIKINERNTQAMYVSSRLRALEDILQLNGWNIPFVNSVKYLDIILDRRMIWRLHIERTVFTECNFMPSLCEQLDSAVNWKGKKNDL
jgi:hypothetical protein